MKTTDYNTQMYLDTINTDSEYKITVKEFKAWLEKNNLTRQFSEDIRRWLIEDDIDFLYSIAWDYNIPIILVKYFAH